MRSIFETIVRRLSSTLLHFLLTLTVTVLFITLFCLLFSKGFEKPFTLKEWDIAWRTGAAFSLPVAVNFLLSLFLRYRVSKALLTAASITYVACFVLLVLTIVMVFIRGVRGFPDLAVFFYPAFGFVLMLNFWIPAIVLNFTEGRTARKENAPPPEENKDE